MFAGRSVHVGRVAAAADWQRGGGNRAGGRRGGGGKWQGGERWQGSEQRAPSIWGDEWDSDDGDKAGTAGGWVDTSEAAEPGSNGSGSRSGSGFTGSSRSSGMSSGRDQGRDRNSERRGGGWREQSGGDFGQRRPDRGGQQWQQRGGGGERRGWDDRRRDGGGSYGNRDQRQYRDQRQPERRWGDQAGGDGGPGQPFTGGQVLCLISDNTYLN
jgi:hypothetical protein